MAGLYVTSVDGALSAKAGKDINLVSSDIISNGKIYLQADRDINLTTITNSRMDHGYASEKDQIKNASSTEIGSFIQAKNDIILQSNNDTKIRAAEINSDIGTVAINTGKKLTIEDGRATTDNLLAYHEEHGGMMSKSTKDVRISSASDTTVGSNITGANVYLQTGTDLNIKGSNVISDNQTLLNAGKDISITSATDQYLNSSQVVKKKSGVMGTGGIGFTIGNMRDATTTTDLSIINTASTVGSLYGDTNIIAADHYTQTGSRVISPEGNIDVLAKQIDINAAQDQYVNDYLHTFKQSGITVAVNVPVINAIQTANTAINRVGKSKNNRVNAMAAFNAGMDTYKAGQAMSEAGQDPKSAAKSVSVSITIGQQNSKEENHSETTLASSSEIYAGGQVNLLATGAGKDSNINIIGSDVAGSEGTYLQADNNINLLAAEQNHSERSSNKSSGWNAGVSIGFGSNRPLIGYTLGVNRGKGYGNGDETTYRNSYIGSSTGNTSIISGGATNIIGAQVIGQGVSIEADELNIESLQDKATYDSKQKNISGQITVGMGVSGSANYSKSKIKADYAAVTEQSGILAEDDGYQIKVKGNTDLKGAIITSTSTAETAGKNRLSTGSLTYSDIQNHSDYKGSSMGIGVGGSISGSTLGQNLSSSNSGINLANQGNTGVNKSIGFGKDSGHSSSTSHSGINTANIIITDEAAQQQKTGKTAALIQCRKNQCYIKNAGQRNQYIA